MPYQKLELEKTPATAIGGEAKILGDNKQDEKKEEEQRIKQEQTTKKTLRKRKGSTLSKIT